MSPKVMQGVKMGDEREAREPNQSIQEEADTDLVN